MSDETTVSNTDNLEPETTAAEVEAAEPTEAENAEPTEAAPEKTPEAAGKPFALQHPPTPEPIVDAKAEAAKEKAREKQREAEEASQSPYSIMVGTVYEGPMDLLLDLIRKQNIDIYDIPIAKITAQFLEYTHHLKQTDVDSAGEFIYTASLLIHIKSKMLLPRDPMEVLAGTDEDPRRELVERLLEHERFKAAAQMLQQRQMLEDATWSQPGMKAFLKDQGLNSADEEREIDADTTGLLLVFRDILKRLRERPIHSIDEETVTVAQMLQYVKQRLIMEDRPISLRKLLEKSKSERALICTFLAMLELVRLQAILLRQTDQLGDILIKKTDDFEQVLSDNAAVRDDWG